MKKSEAKKTLAVNIAFWFVAMLIHPVIRMLPTGSGSPPKIFELLVPLIFLLLAVGSTYLLRVAIGKTQDD